MHACINFFHVHVGVMLFEQRKEGAFYHPYILNVCVISRYLTKIFRYFFLLKIDIKTIHRCFLDLSIDL